MGSTCASVHILWRGSTGDAVKAISRAYAKLGYERTKKAPAEGGKNVILRAHAGEPFISIYDSNNADLDSGELKDAALAASKLLKTGTVFTSLYDSDTYEFVVFNNGRQIDLLMSDVETYSGPLKQLSNKARATQWGKIFAQTLTADQIERAATERTAFANGTLVDLCTLIGLAGDRPQMHYSDFETETDSILASLYFKKKTIMQPALGDGQISLRNYFDRHNSRKLLVYPASWPMPLAREELLTWLMLSEGAGFHGGTATVEVLGPEGLVISKGFMNGCKFHNGQIVGGYELPQNTTHEAALAYLESKRFPLIAIEPVSSQERRYTAEYPNLSVPPMTPERTTQILIVLQLYLTASVAGEWEVKVTLQPHSKNDYYFEPPPARVAALDQAWLPVVSGLNPKTVYNTADFAEDRLPDNIVDIVIRKSGNPHLMGMAAAEARASLEAQQSQQRERNYKAWLYDLQQKQSRLRDERRLNHPAVASNVAVLSDEGQATLDICRSYLEGWLRPLILKSGEMRLRAERHMTETFHVGKVKKTWPMASVLEDKAWGKLFDYGNDYQAVVVEFVRAGAEFPFAGVGLNYSLHDRKTGFRNGRATEVESDEYGRQIMALTLAKMRGRKFDSAPNGSTLHVYNWVLNRSDCYQHLETSIPDMKARVDALAAEGAPLQAWHGQSTWIPRFDQADGYEATIYEDMSILNFFRGILLEQQFGLMDRRMTAEWCSNVLRMITPHMWICGNLVCQVDRELLERVAVVSEINGSYKIEKRPERPMDDLELALLPILPIENSRITVLPSV
ncbi:MAG TPA: hypothetical protein VMU16_03090 [Candidatus Binataceae bacterium]|nr:hypothetical protein [Candidatus Binataceae bacterium]